MALCPTQQTRTLAPNYRPFSPWREPNSVVQGTHGAEPSAHEGHAAAREMAVVHARGCAAAGPSPDAMVEPSRSALGCPEIVLG